MNVDLDLQPAGENDGRMERSDAAANRRLLLRTARALFAAHGVANVTMADIAREAQVGKGTLYRRFDNKGALCYALLDESLQAFQDSVLRDLRQMAVEGLPYLMQLDAFLDALVHYTVDNLPYLCELSRADFGPAERFNLPHQWQVLTIRVLLDEAVQRGEARADLDVDGVAAVLLAPLNALVLRMYLDGLGFDVARISAVLRTLVAGLRQ